MFKVNGIDLRGLKNRAAASLLKSAGPVVHLSFLRHTSGRLHQQLLHMGRFFDKKLKIEFLKFTQIIRILECQEQILDRSLKNGVSGKNSKVKRRRSVHTERLKAQSNRFGSVDVCITGGHRPLKVCPAQSEVLVAPQLHSEDSDTSYKVSSSSICPLSTWTCQSLPVLYASIKKSPSISSHFDMDLPDQTSISSVLIEEQTTSSTAASLTLNSSPLDEIYEAVLTASSSTSTSGKNTSDSMQLFHPLSATYFGNYSLHFYMLTKIAWFYI